MFESVIEDAFVTRSERRGESTGYYETILLSRGEDCASFGRLGIVAFCKDV
jgi:hypothetical protein